MYSVIGEDTILTAAEIKEALWYYYFDREETINWALGKIRSKEGGTGRTLMINQIQQRKSPKKRH